MQRFFPFWKTDMWTPIRTRLLSRRHLLRATAVMAAIRPFTSMAKASTEPPLRHIVLLGDSIFDNASYVAGGPDVVQQLRERLPDNWRATLNAVDGSVMTGVAGQVQRLPADASHLVLSIGGNDALRQSYVLDETARSVAEALGKITSIREQFQRDYHAMLENVLKRRLPVAICTIYDARFPDSRRRALATTALTIFNDVITRAAFSRGLPLIDLRLICNDDADFANPIEPSVHGGAKISAAIAELALDHDFAQRRSVVFV
jgi:lysophospholipase L1-like esterase